MGDKGSVILQQDAGDPPRGAPPVGCCDKDRRADQRDRAGATWA